MAGGGRWMGEPAGRHRIRERRRSRRRRRRRRRRRERPGAAARASQGAATSAPCAGSPRGGSVFALGAARGCSCTIVSWPRVKACRGETDAHCCSGHVCPGEPLSGLLAPSGQRRASSPPPPPPPQAQVQPAGSHAVDGTGSVDGEEGSGEDGDQECPHNCPRSRGEEWSTSRRLQGAEQLQATPSKPPARPPPRCEHKREKRRCKACGGSQSCELSRRKDQCSECSPSVCPQKRTRAGAMSVSDPTSASAPRQRSQCKP